MSGKLKLVCDLDARLIKDFGALVKSRGMSKTYIVEGLLRHYMRASNYLFEDIIHDRRKGANGTRSTKPRHTHGGHR